MTEDTTTTQAVIRKRAIILGLIFAVLICAITPFNNIYRQATQLGGGHFPLAPFFLFFCLSILVSAAGKIFNKNFWLTGKELLTTWVLTVLVSGIAYTGLTRTFFINLTAPFQFATVGNNWDKNIQPLLPKALYPQSSQAIKQLYDGLEGGHNMGWLEVLQKIPWETWLTPLVSWIIFILLCYTVMLCLVNIFSRQWLQNERMNFPLLQVPQIIEEAMDKTGLGSILRNRFLLIGLSIPVALHLINGLSFYFPSVPQVPTLILAGPYFPKQGLFSGFIKLKIYIYPAFIGFAFLTTRQISFSFWLFFLLGGLTYGFLELLGYSIPAAALGVTFGPTLTRPEETQMIGSYLVFFGFIIWLARQHLVTIGKQAIGLTGGQPAQSEWISTRLSLWVGALAFIGIMSWTSYFGMPLLLSVLVLIAFFITMLVATRVICQGGLAYFTLTSAPLDGLMALFGPQFFTQIGLVLTAVMQKVLFVDLRGSLMPSLFHARKVTSRVGSQRVILGSIVAALIAGITVSFAAMLALCYKYGIRELQMDWATRTTHTMYQNLNSLIELPSQSGSWVMIFSIIGGLVTLALVICYQRFYWWPIHPLGYLTAYSSAMKILWFSFFVGWLFNMLCMRYGGVALFSRFRFLFAGMIIGDFLMGGAWAVVGLFSDVSYLSFPG